MMKMRSWFTGILLLGLLCATGCWLTGTSKSKIPSEDIDVVKLYAAEIATLHNNQLSPGSKEKYEAARKLAEEIDFSYTRNVRTLDNIFGAHDAMSAVISTTSECVYFRYTFEDKRVEFSFARTGNTVTTADVRIE